jgi:hypothetical protein
MKKIIHISLYKFIALAALLLITFSCSDDDDKGPVSDCSAVLNELEDKYAELDEVGYNCTKMKEIFNEILDLLEKNKNCDEMKQKASDEGYDNVDEYIDDLANSFQAYMSDCPG